MKNGCCSQPKSKVATIEWTWARAVGRLISWIVPGVVLAAMPKCPLCLAAYVAIFTGFGISLAAASFAWWVIAIACVAILIYLATTKIREFLKFQ